MGDSSLTGASVPTARRLLAGSSRGSLAAWLTLCRRRPTPLVFGASASAFVDVFLVLPVRFLLLVESSLLEEPSERRSQVLLVAFARRAVFSTASVMLGEDQGGGGRGGRMREFGYKSKRASVFLVELKRAKPE